MRIDRFKRLQRKHINSQHTVKQCMVNFGVNQELFACRDYYYDEKPAARDLYE